MQVKIFNTNYQIDPQELNAFLAEDGKTVCIKNIHTCAAGYAHFVTVEYYELPEKQEAQK